MAQLVEWSLPTPVVRGSNPGLSKFYIPTVDENKKKPGMGQINTCYIKMALFDVEYTYQCQRFETYRKCYTIMTSCKFVYLMQSQSASTFSFFFPKLSSFLMRFCFTASIVVNSKRIRKRVFNFQFKKTF